MSVTLTDLNRQMGEAHTKLDAIIKSQDDMAPRLKSLEESRSRAIGWLACFSLVFTIGFDYMKAKLFGG